MAETTAKCNMCTKIWPTSEFINAWGKIAKTCQACRGKARAATKARATAARAAAADERERGVRSPGNMCTCTRCRRLVPYCDVDNGMGGTFDSCVACRDKEAKRARRVWKASKQLHTPCVECGEMRLFALQHAHVTRANKRRAVGAHRSIRALQEERSKTRTLCFLCHASETVREEPLKGEVKYPGPLRRRCIVDDVLFNSFGGQCQFPCCAFTVLRTDAIARKRCMHWDHQPASPHGTKLQDISWMVAHESDDNKLRAELKKCIPLCTAHHLLVTMFRRRKGYEQFCVSSSCQVPPEMAAAAAATTEMPDAYLALWE